MEQQQDNSKVDKKFQANMQKLIAIFNGEENISSGEKVANDQVTDIINEMLIERTKKTKEEFKAKAAAIIDKKIEFDAFVKKQEKEFKNTVTKKKEEFNKEIENLFSLVESIDKLRENYRKTLSGEDSGEDITEISKEEA